MFRLGLCCKFFQADIRFREITALRLGKLPEAGRLPELSRLCLINAEALSSALAYCAGNGIGSFRINSQILPLKTHPLFGYELQQLPDYDEIFNMFRRCRSQALAAGIRLTFHPDQFILLNSPRVDVVAASLKDLAYHVEISEMVGADVINIHGGGGYGDKPAALARLHNAIMALPSMIRSRLTLENDDRIFTPADLLPMCRETGIPLVYDVHHHRCLADGLTVAEATLAALSTWDREPLFHISSPRDGWNATNPRPHHDYIDINDFPSCWRDLAITIEVEAKAKELAVARLAAELKTNT